VKDGYNYNPKIINNKTMKKLLAVAIILMTLTGCIGADKNPVFEGVSQKYFVADLSGDPNNRNVFRATTVWADDAVFEMLLPDYWEVKIDKEDIYKTDIYLTSSEYEDDACVVLAGTMGYGIPEDYEKELWQTTVAWGMADDYYFYEKISEEERRPVIRIVEFHDDASNYYVFELRFPETEYDACNADFSNMIATFKTLQGTIEENYIEQEIFEEKWPSIAFKNLGNQEDKIVIDYSPNWEVADDAEGNDILAKPPTDNTFHAGVEARDLSEAASYEEDVLVLDNNEMAEKYLLYDANGNLYMEVVKIMHNDVTYNFELKNPTSLDEASIEEFETMVKSFRTLAEENAAKQGYSIFDEEEV